MVHMPKEGLRAPQTSQKSPPAKPTKKHTVQRKTAKKFENYDGHKIENYDGRKIQKYGGHTFESISFSNGWFLLFTFFL